MMSREIMSKIYRSFVEFNEKGQSEYVEKFLKSDLNTLDPVEKKKLIDTAVRLSRTYREYLKKNGIEVPPETCGYCSK